MRHRTIIGQNNPCDGAYAVFNFRRTATLLFDGIGGRGRAKRNMATFSHLIYTLIAVISGPAP